jgi:D-alanyl-D-alanine carboxypeptidase/D-alanyl-D-alanine-endopeptidase (penicillin-binding protein 4)
MRLRVSHYSCTRRRFLPAALAATLLAAAVPPSPAGEPAPGAALRSRVDALLQKAPKGLRAGIRLAAADGTVLVARDDDAPFIPASNLKLVTTAAAALRLGSRFEWVTTLGTRGTRRPDGVLEGDLIVVGSGDPDFSGRFHGGNPAAVFERWADALLRENVREVTGDLLLDDTAFDREFYPAVWEEKYLVEWFAAQTAGLSLNDNCIDLTLRPGAQPGDPIGIAASPETAHVRIVNAAKTVPGKVDEKLALLRAKGSNEIRVTGTLGVQCGPGTHYITVHDPVTYFGTVLKETLERKGVAVRGSPKPVPADFDPATRPAVFVAEHRSGLPAALQVVNQRSQNFYAEQILRTLGGRARGKGTRENGIAAVQEALAPLELPDPVVQEDGCGLARGNRVTARTLATLLVRMLGQPEDVRRMFVDSLAVPGGEGSLSHRFTEEACRTRVKAKTGYINGVSTLSGYLETKGGTRVAFSILMNGVSDVSRARQLQDAIVKAAIDME